MKIIQAVKFGGFEITVANGLKDDELALLKRTILGNPGGFRYKLFDVEEKIKAYKNIYFFTGRRQDRLIGLIAYCQRVAYTNGKPSEFFYVRYLTIDLPFQVKVGKKGLYKRRAAKQAVEGSAKDRIIQLLNHPELAKILDHEKGEKPILYNILEAHNQRSEALILRSGYEHIRDIVTVPFSRYFPKGSPNVTRVLEEEKEEIRAKLMSFYNNYSIFTTEHLFHKDLYYTFKEEGKIVAGLQVHPVTYKLEEIPGLRALLLLRVLPRLPLLNRIISPSRFNFLALDSMFCLPGKWTALFELVESVCAQHKIYSAVMWFDAESPLYKTFKGKRMGMLNRMFSGKHVKLYAKFSGHSEEVKKVLNNTPVYISAFDVT